MLSVLGMQGGARQRQGGPEAGNRARARTRKECSCQKEATGSFLSYANLTRLQYDSTKWEPAK